MFMATPLTKDVPVGALRWRPELVFVLFVAVYSVFVKTFLMLISWQSKLYRFNT